MGSPVYHCWRWQGAYPELRDVDARGAGASLLPPLTVRGWLDKPTDLYEGCCSDVYQALKWLWDEMTYVDKWVREHHPDFVLSIEEDFRTARARLDSLESACDWNTRLPDGADTFVVAAIVGVFQNQAVTA